MNTRRRIELLEKEFQTRRDDDGDGAFRPDIYGFRVAGMKRSQAQEEVIRRLRNAIADPRATESQRDSWQRAIERIEPALRSQLNRERGRGF